MTAWTRLTDRTLRVLQGGALVATMSAAAVWAGENETLSVISKGNGSPPFYLTLSANPGAAGSVAANPEGDVDETTYSTVTVVTLTATPNSGNEFVFWGGDVDGTSNPVTQVTMDTDRAIVGNFRATSGGASEQFSLDTGATPSNGGTIQLAPSPVVGDQFVSGTGVTLTAQPNSGFAFREWSGDGITAANKNQNPLGITITDTTDIEAFFRSTSGDDNYEPNNTFTDAQAIFLPPGTGITSITNLVMGAGNEDWYLLSLPKLQHVRIDVIFQHTAGDLQAQLWDRRSVNNLAFGQAVGESYSSSAAFSQEVLTYANVSNPDELYLRIFGEGGVGNAAYTLQFTTVDVDDAFDIAGANNGPCETVTGLTLTGLNAQRVDEDLILRDEDWYRITLPNGATTLDVEVSHFYFSGDLNFMLITDNGNCGSAFSNIFAGSFSTNAGENFERLNGVDVSGRSSVLLRVFGATNFMRNQYDLKITAH